MLRTGAIVVLLGGVGCSPAPVGGRATQTAIGQEDGPDAGADAPVDTPVDAAPDASCGTLCGPGDTLSVTFDPFTRYVDDETQGVTFDSIGGSVTLTVDVWGNFGTLGEDDGLTVSIDGGPPCRSLVRHDSSMGDESVCTALVATTLGTNAVPVKLHQWNGGDGWTVRSEVVTVTVQGP